MEDWEIHSPSDVAEAAFARSFPSAVGSKRPPDQHMDQFAEFRPSEYASPSPESLSRPSVQDAGGNSAVARTGSNPVSVRVRVKSQEFKNWMASGPECKDLLEADLERILAETGLPRASVRLKGHVK